LLSGFCHANEDTELTYDESTTVTYRGED